MEVARAGQPGPRPGVQGVDGGVILSEARLRLAGEAKDLV